MIASITRAAIVAVVVATTLALAVPAGAQTQASAHHVSGDETGGLVSGSLEGQMVDTLDTFASFLATRTLTPSGILTWRAPVLFEGCVVDVGCGTLQLEGHFFYRFQPGTTYYDFEGPLYQPGTVGDPEAWISGEAVYVIAGGEGALEGASGMLTFTETVFLSEHTYRGVVKV